MAQRMVTSPAVLKFTGVEVPGAWLPRLNSLPAVVDRMLCAMLSSFTNVRLSPFLIETALSENTRPFCMIERSAASAAAQPPAKAINAATVIIFIECSFVFDESERQLCLSRQHWNGGGIHFARQRLH